MRDGSCPSNVLRSITGAAALLICLLPLRADAQQNDYYTHAPAPPVSDATQGAYTNTGYNGMLSEIEMRLAALEDNEEKAKEEDACKEIDIQTKPSHKFRGRVYLDQLWMDDLENGGAVFPQDNLTGFDTARIGVTGNIYENLKYTAEFEFEGGETDYKDVQAQQENLPFVGHLKIGFFKEYAGLEQMTSSRFITFMERSGPTSVFTPSRNFGFTFWNYTDETENFSWYAGLFRGGARDNRTHRGTGSTGDGFNGDSNDWSVTARAVWLPYYDEATPGRCLLHLGGWASLRRMGNTNHPGGHGNLEGFLGLDSKDGPIDVFLPNGTEFNVFGTEAAYMRGPFFIQNEFFFTDSNVGGGSVTPWGTYATVGYFLTGENRGYKKSSKAFNRVKPYEPFFLVRTADGIARGMGAWEVAARYSYLDVNEPLLLATGGGSDGIGRQENITLGVNWYWNPYTRVMFNYVHSISDVTQTNNAVATPTGKFEGDHFGMRFQFDW